MIFNLQRFSHFLLLLAALLGGGGCQLFNREDAAATDYDQLRRDVEGRYSVESASNIREEKRRQQGLLGDFSPSSIAKNVRQATGLGDDPKRAQASFAEGESLYQEALRLKDAQREAKLLSAAKKYQDAANRWPESALELDALFMAGECYFFADHYVDANEYYEKLLKNYPNARQLDIVEARRFAIAQYWLRYNQYRPESFYSVNFLDERRPWRDSFGNAVRVFDKVRLDDPTGRLADDATLAAANAYFARGDYVRADEFYTDLRDTFPSSEHQFQAHFLGLQCKLENYDGPAYDGDSLGEAEDLIRRMRRLFPQEAEREAEFLKKAFAEVRYRQAEREYFLATYHDRRQEYGAARYHYQLILDQYSEVSPFAEPARTRMPVIEGYPEVPPQRLSWLVNLFPQSERTRPLLPSQTLR